MSEQAANEAGNDEDSVTGVLPDESPMVQAVAAAIFLAKGDAIDQAKAALRALRNPTDEMLGGQYGIEPRKMFTEMIDAALFPGCSGRGG